MNTKKIDTCSCTVIHSDVINKVKNVMPIEENLYDLAEFFKVFGDSTRIKILYALSVSEMCVCDLSNLLSISQSAISHQLRVLKNSRLVKYKRVGKVVYYSLDDHHIQGIFNQGLEHVNEHKE
ncbi:ArsR family transcriptional regulator [Natranaerovirga hydrolytica]|uniref:ArsR family transcriptional regulator n=1 Tax=Natranaerovirga hydrolytica TaxID=680378 RepID=A0A4R1MX41_9FIRM|nr:metalloregulator ArsR/SmtB family transcription factor [Natranaerovirga hydrolytica]TCK97817.1 ArsR family transcriptional regulator [Natranaerovirga hydrolytica]